MFDTAIQAYKLLMSAVPWQRYWAFDLILVKIEAIMMSFISCLIHSEMENGKQKCMRNFVLWKHKTKATQEIKLCFKHTHTHTHPCTANTAPIEGEEGGVAVSLRLAGDP